MRIYIPIRFNLGRSIKWLVDFSQFKQETTTYLLNWLSKPVQLNLLKWRVSSREDLNFVFLTDLSLCNNDFKVIMNVPKKSLTKDESLFEFHVHRQPM